MQTASQLQFKKRNWNLLWVITSLAAIFGMFFFHISLWIPVGFALTGMVVSHLLLFVETQFPLPHVAVLLASVYYLFAPLLSLYYPSENPLFYLPRDADLYFSFAVPCLISLTIGWSRGCLQIVGSMPTIKLDRVDRKITNGLDLLLFGGMAAAVLFAFLQVPIWAKFIALLIGNVRFFGALGWLVLGCRGWKLRLTIVLLFELYASTSTGFFLDFALWSLSAGVIYINRHRLSRKVILSLMCAGVFLLPCIQYAKWDFRRAVWGVEDGKQSLEVFGLNVQLTPLNKPPLLVAKIVESGIQLLALQNTDQFISETVVRYNQGWIIGRVLEHVPGNEPFARGETIRSAAISSILPRLVYREKMESGGAGIFTRFTGIVLNENTSMNLGFVGEMYANFGYFGGIIGCGLYGLLLGSVLRVLLVQSVVRPILMAFIPYILNFAVVSEVGLLEVLNYTVKSSWFAIAIYYSFPALFSRRKGDS